MIRVAIVTVSDSVSSGEREDRSGAAVAERCRKLGWEVSAACVVADDEPAIRRRLAELADAGHADVILTAGGTGLGPRDVTPEATAAVASRLVPGLAERMRAAGCEKDARAALSRSIAGVRRKALIVNLPGSPRGAVESFDAVAELFPHAVEVLRGAGHD